MKTQHSQKQIKIKLFLKVMKAKDIFENKYLKPIQDHLHAYTCQILRLSH